MTLREIFVKIKLNNYCLVINQNTFSRLFKVDKDKQ
mgnify:CR=1 FL=1